MVENMCKIGGVVCDKCKSVLWSIFVFPIIYVKIYYEVFIKGSDKY